jgi:O-Antigen ligase
MEPAVSDQTSQLPFPILLLVAAIAAGAVAQGGFYPTGRILVAVMTGLALAAALAPRERRWDARDTWPVAIACAALAAWAGVRAAVEGTPWAGLPAVTTLACMVAAMVVLRRADEAQRELCAVTVVGIGVLVAISGWIGFVWRVQPLALPGDERLWRASSTLTYANAAAALLAPLAILMIALLIDRPRAYTRQVAVFLVLVGLGATFSRGGMLGFTVGLVVLAVLAGVRPTARHVAAPLLGAIVAVAALAPSVPDSERPQPALALAGLAAGLVIVVGIPRLPGRWPLVAVPAGVIVTAGAVAVLASSGRWLDLLARDRASLSSPTRTESARAALRLFAEHPIAGVGPGRSTFPWMMDGRLVTGRYAHNEYLQLLTELGAVGLALLLFVLAALAYTIHRGRPGTRPAPLWAGAAAAFAAMIVHSGFDFLWQLPVIPLTAALLVGLAGPARPTVWEAE